MTLSPEMDAPVAAKPKFSLAFFKKKPSSNNAMRLKPSADAKPLVPPLVTDGPALSNGNSPVVRVVCHSPGGRANVQLAVPVAPGVFPRRSGSTRALTLPTDAATDAAMALYQVRRRARGRADTVPMLESPRSFADYEDDYNVQDSELVVVMGPVDMRRCAPEDADVDELVLTRPRDLAADPRVTCCPARLHRARHAARERETRLVFAIRSTKWAAYFLGLVARGSRARPQRLDARAALSLRWVICALVRHEVDHRRARQARLEAQMSKKMTEYRVAIECIAGTSGVLKFGRKGRPHVTQLSVENGETLRWTAKPAALAAASSAMNLTGMKKKTSAATASSRRQRRGIPLAAVLHVRTGPTTDVLSRALHKGTLGHADAAGCTLSLVTKARTLDLKARSPAEREWLARSLRFLVDLAREHERRVAQQAELAIMKRLEGVDVWKHGRRGRPHKTRVFVNRFGEVSWLGRSNDSLQLDEIREVRVGLETPVFARSLAAGHATAAAGSRCLSLVTSARTLDLEAATETQRDWFVVAFRYLLDKVHEKTAALERERAEKQLRLLQELCGGASAQGNDDGGRLQAAPLSSYT